jgi:hypothetical protein
MQEKPKNEPSAGNEDDDRCDEPASKGSENRRSYYYDDAHGYSDYQPDEDDDPETDLVSGLDGDPPPDALPESKNTQRASRHMCNEDRDPDVYRLQSGKSGYHCANA